MTNRLVNYWYYRILLVIIGVELTTAVIAAVMREPITLVVSLAVAFIAAYFARHEYKGGRPS